MRHRLSDIRTHHVEPACFEAGSPAMRLRCLPWLAVALSLIGVVSGCARLDGVWSTSDLLGGAGDEGCLPGISDGDECLPFAEPSLAERMRQFWTSPISQSTDPFGDDEAAADLARNGGPVRRGRLAQKAHDIWNTPIAELTDPASHKMADVWNKPVYTLTEPFSQTVSHSVSDVWNRPFFWNNGPPPEFVDPTPYRDWATEIDYPDVASPPPPAEMFMAEPRHLRNLQKDEIWDMTLEQAIQIALSNSHIIRSSGQFLNPGNPLLNNPEFVASSLDPAIQESGVLFGQRGVEAALSEFDAQFTTSMVWGRDERVQNSIIGTGIPPGQTLVQETGNFSSSLTKRLATGGVVGVIHDWNYLGSNLGDFIPNQRLFPSTYTGRVRVEARQPLWAGAGTEYTRIAGPISEQIAGVTGVQQGVIIARINNDIELTEFEGAIRNLLRDVESLYWQLYLAYQNYGSEMSLLAEATESYRNVQILVQSESPLAGALEESDAIEFVYQVQARVDQARDNLYDLEAQLRRILGLLVNDGKVIRPLDEPTIAEYMPDWDTTLIGALARRVELRKQKWNIKQLQLQLQAAEHLVKPRLDLVAAYQVNGFGDNLLGNTSDGGATARGLGNAAATVTRGDETSWNLGVEFSVPLGMRFAHTQVQNLELRLAKANAALAEAEVEVGHELADTFRELARSYLAMTNGYNRKMTAVRRLDAIEALHRRDPERYTEDAILRSRDQLNQVEQAYLQALIEYNIALMELHYRGGLLLEMNNVHLSEGPWTPEAEYDVYDRGYDRWHSIPTANMLHHEPAPFVTHGAAAPVGPPVEGYGPAVRGWTQGRDEQGIPASPPVGEPEQPIEEAPLPPGAPNLEGPPSPKENDAPSRRAIDGPVLQIGESIEIPRPAQ